MISNIIISQFKTVPILIISHFMYKETKWTAFQIIGAILLTFGTAIFSFSNFYKKEKNGQSHILTDKPPSETLEINDLQIEEEEIESNDQNLQQKN